MNQENTEETLTLSAWEEEHPWLALSRAEDDEDYVELGPIFEAKGLVSGDRKSFTDDDGIVRVRVTSNDKATGTITFAEE